MTRKKQLDTAASVVNKLYADREQDALTLQLDGGTVLALARTHAYLEQFCSHTATQSNKVSIDLPIRQYGVFTGLIQQDYELGRHNQSDAHIVRLNFSLYHPQKGLFQHFQAENDMNFLAALREDGVKVLASRMVGLNTPSQRVIFELEGNIPVQLEFRADMRAGSVALCMTNFDMLGTRCYTLKPEQITAEFLRQMGRFLLRRHNSFLKDTLAISSNAADRDDKQSVRNPAPARAQKSAEILEFEVADLFARKQVVLRYHDKEQCFDSSRATCRLGRKFPADILIRSRFASRDHATLGMYENQFLLHDHSSNGIYIKPEGREMIHVHNGPYRLEGRGVFCLGEAISDNNPDLIVYEVKLNP